MNKNGWGLRVELAFLLLFLICLLIATIGLHRMGLLGTDNGIYTDDGTINESVNFDYNALKLEYFQSDIDEIKGFWVAKGLKYNSKVGEHTKGR